MNRRSNEEKYKKSFQTLHLSDDFQERFEKRLKEEREGKNMDTNGIYRISRTAAVIAACALAFGSLGICYAADVGGIRTNFEMWINGSRQEVELEQVSETEYRWTDEDGGVHQMGGVMKEGDGSERPMTGEELVDQTNAQCNYEEGDGRSFISYKSLRADVTDLIGADNTLYIHIDDPENPSTYFCFRIQGRDEYTCTADCVPAEGVEYHELEYAGE
ncbi:MAG: hypothetical protein K6E50_02530 [Lachnospiraceae bacterium]|nr:hypothetical protein [Lachnospiraceae bacterium]